MKNYYVFGVIAAAALIIGLLFMSTGGAPAVNFPQGYSAAGYSLRSAVYSDILGLQIGQNSIPAGKAAYYRANYSILTSSAPSGGAQNGSETAEGTIVLMHGIDGNSESVSNFTVTVPYSAGAGYALSSVSYMFGIGNDTYLCTRSSSSGGNAECTNANRSMRNISDGILGGLDGIRITLLRDYNTIYKGYPCLFTVSSFSLSINGSGFPLIAGNKKLDGILTSCLYKKYNITVMNSLAATISISLRTNGTILNSTSFISYNESIDKISSFNADVTKNSLPNESV